MSTIEATNLNTPITPTAINNINSANFATNPSDFCNTRLDLDIYLMGEAKEEFINFLGECFKENFFETLSWSNFRRFQLVLSNKKNWINLHIFLIKNECSGDVLINSFKIYEKRNITLLMYNFVDKKSEKHADQVIETLITERNKIYEGILNEESMNKNIEKISGKENYQNLPNEKIKSNLEFLTSENVNENLIFKVGFKANNFNKKTKNIKKTDQSSSYKQKDLLFYLQDKSEACDFSELLCLLLTEHFRNFNLIKCPNVNNFLDLIKFFNTPKKNVIQRSKKFKMMPMFIKTIDWLILIYILTSFYKFFSS